MEGWRGVTADTEGDGMAEQESFGALLRRLRLSADLTLEQLSEASGVSDRAISDMERGVSRGPRVRTVDALSGALQLTGDDRAALLDAARAGRGGAPAAAVGRLPLPRRITDFTGRRDEITRLSGWLTGSPAPVVMISGPPGVGKTSLAARAALGHDAEDRYFLDLRGLDAAPLRPAVALNRLIRAVNPAVGAVPPDVDEASALWHTLVQDRRIVVVLDNAINESQVRPVLPPDGPAAVLVTSRRGLGGLEGVHRLHLDPLPEDDAVSLLSAILDDPAVPPDGLRRIAELCVNTPLALRIAANRLVSRPGWSTDDLIARLTAQERRLDALSAGDLQVKAAFTLSYQQLSGVARRLFRRLALVPGASTGVELASVLVQEPPVETEDALDELVDLSLLQQGPDGRLQFHDLLRLYAGLELEREESAADRSAAVHRRDTWLLDTTVAAGRYFEPGYGPPPPGSAEVPFAAEAAAGDWLRLEADNWLPVLIEAASDGQDQRVVDVAESLHWFSDQWAYWPGWTDVYTLSARAAERLGDDRLQAVHLGYLCWVYTFCLSRPEEGLAYALRALEHARRAGDTGQTGWANYYASWSLSRLGREEEALGYSRAATDELRRAGDREGLPNALLAQAMTFMNLGRHDDAIPMLTEVTTLVADPATAPPPHIAMLSAGTAFSYLVEIAIAGRRWPEALRYADQSVDAAVRASNEMSKANAHIRRAEVYARMRDAGSARADLDSARAIWAALDGQLKPTVRQRKRIADVEALLAGDQDATKSSR